MASIGFLLYLSLFIITIILGLYNFIYSREVYRIEKNIGVTLPLYIHKLLKTALFLSIGLSLVSAFMAIITFFFR